MSLDKIALSKVVELEKYNNVSIASVILGTTIIGNVEIIISSIDTTADTFTSNNHGLIDGDIICPTINNNSGIIYPLQKYAGGMTQTKYFVVNSTINTFQISPTLGGGAVNLTTNATIDLTKWHFEKNPVTNIVLSNLGGFKKYKLKINGKGFTISTSNFSIYPSSPINWHTQVFSYSTAYNYPMIASSNGGTININAYIEIDSINPSIYWYGGSVDVNNGSSGAFITTQIQNILMSLDQSFINNEITSITVNHPTGFANGFKIEVWKL